MDAGIVICAPVEEVLLGEGRRNLKYVNLKAKDGYG